MAAGSWWEGTLRWQSTTAHASVLALIALVLLLALLAGRGRQAERTPRRLGARRNRPAASTGGADPTRRVSPWRAHPAASIATTAWALLAAAVLAWDLVSVTLGTPARPTLSKLAGDLTRHVAGRAALTFAWVALGLALALGSRLRARRSSLS